MAETQPLRGFKLTPQEPTLDLNALLEGRVVLHESSTTAPTSPAPRAPQGRGVSTEVRQLLETTGLRSALSESVEWPATLDKQIELLNEMMAEFQSALARFKEGVKEKASPAELQARLAATRYLGGRLSSALYGVTDGSFALAGGGMYL